MIALDWFRTIQILAANESLVCWTFCVREFGLPAGLTITSMDPTFTVMCGRIIQSSPPFQLAIAEGLDGRGSRFHDYSPRWNSTPSQTTRSPANHHTAGLLDPCARADPYCADHAPTDQRK